MNSLHNYNQFVKYKSYLGRNWRNQGEQLRNWIWPAVTSLGFPDLTNKIEFALAHPSGVKGRLSIRVLTLSMRNSFRQENLLIALISSLSVSVQNWFQNWDQSRYVPSNLVTFILLFHLQLHFFNFQLFFHSSYEPLLLHLIFFLSDFCFFLLKQIFQTSFQSIN